jgi:hypothetical protein
VKNGKCPKCDSDKVFHGAEIPAKFGPFGSNSIPITMLSIASLDNYVCTECGYLESYVAESTKLKEISKKWPKVKAEAEASS